MLFKNDVFLDGGVRYRLLHADADSGLAWVISLDDPKALPASRYWSELKMLVPQAATNDTVGSEPTTARLEPASHSLNATPAMRKVRDKAIEILGDIHNQVPAIFDPHQRSQLVHEREQQGFSRVSVYKHLRRFWQGGQSPSALLGDFHRCGRHTTGMTEGRGAKPRFDYDVYQVEQTDCEKFADIIDNLYLKDKRLLISQAYQRLLERHYQAADGNGDLWVKPHGERPSLKQFEYYLRTRYTLEHRLRQREGAKDFERDHRAILDTVLTRCQGVGHQYEADASIADVYLVAESDRKRIVGKPTLYFIIDRKSRLIVGWYVGLENSSWVCALQALLTVSLDKRAICERYGVKYNESDWPAHEVFPDEIIADREMLQKASDQIADDLCTRVFNLPSQRPEHKPVVECQFKLTRMRLQDGTPGFDPPENAKRRMGKHYEQDASLTLEKFTELILNAIIEHNRTPMKAYDLSLQERSDAVEPSPLGIWRHNIATRTGLLTRYTADRVRLALLPRAEATVSEEGIEFGGCFYTCEEALQRGWFVAARKRRFKVTVSYDGRLVDRLYVHASKKFAERGQVYECVLTKRSEKFRGMSFPEVKVYEHLRVQMTPAIDQGRIQARATYHAAADPINSNARQELKAAGPKSSRTSRRADIKADRQAELRKERQEVAAPQSIQQSSTHQVAARTVAGPVAAGGAKPSTAQVVSLQAKRAATAATSGTAVPTVAAAVQPSDSLPPDSSTTPIPLSLAERIRLQQERMHRG
jgi:putative transposase